MTGLTSMTWLGLGENSADVLQKQQVSLMSLRNTAFRSQTRLRDLPETGSELLHRLLKHCTEAVVNTATGNVQACGKTSTDLEEHLAV